MYEFQGSVLGVTGRQVGSQQKTIYDVAMTGIANGEQFNDKMSTFNGTLAQAAAALQGQQVSARFEIRINGEYKNYDLKEIAASGALPAAAMPAAGGTPVLPTVAGAPAVQIPVTPAEQRIPDAERQRLIVRQSVLATSFGFVGRLLEGAGPEAITEGKETALALAKELGAAVWGNEVVAAPTTATEVAQVVNATVPGAVQVGVAETPPAEGAPTPAW